MEQENVGTIIPGEAAPVDAGEADAPSYSPEIINEARRTGWKPKEEFRGNPDKWTPPDAWVERAETVLPIATAAQKKLAKQVEDLQAKLDAQAQDFSARLQRQQAMEVENLKRQRQAIIRDYESAKVAAAREGDADKVARLETAKQEALAETLEREHEITKEPEKPKTEPKKPELPENVQAWVDRNPWFLQDQVLHQAAAAHDQYLKRTKPGLTVDQHLAAVEQHVKKMYPDAFGASADDAEVEDEPAPRRSAVASGGRAAGSAPATQSALARKLPAEARQAGQRFVQDGLYKNLDEYAKVYFDQPGA